MFPCFPVARNGEWLFVKIVLECLKSNHLCSEVCMLESPPYQLRGDFIAMPCQGTGGTTREEISGPPTDNWMENWGSCFGSAEVQLLMQEDGNNYMHTQKLRAITSQLYFQFQINFITFSITHEKMYDPGNEVLFPSFYIRLLPMNAQNETSVRVNMMHDPEKHRGLCPRRQCGVSSVHLSKL